MLIFKHAWQSYEMLFKHVYWRKAPVCNGFELISINSLLCIYSNLIKLMQIIMLFFLTWSKVGQGMALWKIVYSTLHQKEWILIDLFSLYVGVGTQWCTGNITISSTMSDLWHTFLRYVVFNFITSLMPEISAG